MDDDNDEPLSLGYNDWDDERKARFDAARQRVAAGIAECVTILREDTFADDLPFVQGWVAVAEWTNIEAERDNWGGRETITPHGQMLSVGLGLSAWSAHRHT